MSKSILLLTLGTAAWTGLFAFAIYVLREVARIDARLAYALKAAGTKEAKKNRIRRIIWIAGAVFAALIPPIAVAVFHGIAFAKTFFLVTFGILPWIVVSTSLITFIPIETSVQIVAFAIYILLAVFLANLVMKSKRSTLIAVYASAIAVLIIGYTVSFFITLKFFYQ